MSGKLTLTPRLAVEYVVLCICPPLWYAAFNSIHDDRDVALDLTVLQCYKDPPWNRSCASSTINEEPLPHTGARTGKYVATFVFPGLGGGASRKARLHLVYLLGPTSTGGNARMA